MDKCEVVIISHGRADNVITKKNVANCKLVVCKKDYDIYKEFNKDIEIIAGPEELGIMQNTKFCSDYFGDVFILNDDISCVMASYKKINEKNVLTKEEAYDVIQNAYCIAKLLDVKIFGFADAASPIRYKVNKPFLLSGFIRGHAYGLIKGHEFDFSSDFELATDFYLSLQNAYLYRKCFIDTRFSFVAKYISEGGLAYARNKDEIQKQYAKLRFLYGDAIKRKNFSSLSLAKRKTIKKESDIHFKLDIPF
jgi:hypothetical protein